MGGSGLENGGKKQRFREVYKLNDNLMIMQLGGIGNKLAEGAVEGDQRDGLLVPVEKNRD